MSSRAVITGMKMALFDVSNPVAPKELSNVVIGDRRTSSAILTNHKALLFSKERNLLAIPVNNYETDFEIDYSGDNIETLQSYYVGGNGRRVGEGYLVYDVNLESGIVAKGLITHASRRENGAKRSPYLASQSRLLRGLYIDNNLYTVSQTGIKINQLDDLSLVGMLPFGSDPLDSEFATASATVSAELIGSGGLVVSEGLNLSLN
jgi:uncharacterized secreted protein with C-terminal beta-propeller domain